MSSGHHPDVDRSPAAAHLEEVADGIDLSAAIGDMIAYNGGQPLRCYA